MCFDFISPVYAGLFVIADFEAKTRTLAVSYKFRFLVGFIL